MSNPYPIRLPLDVLDALRAIARAEERSLAKQIAYALREWVASRRAAV